MPRTKQAEGPERAPRIVPPGGAQHPKLIAVGGGPYVLDSDGTLYRADAGQETVDGVDGPVVVNVVVLTPIQVRYAPTPMPHADA